MTRIETIASFLCRYCRVLGLIMILSTAVPVLYLCGLGFDNSVKMWLDQSSTPYQQYEAFLSRYGSDEFTLIVCETESPFSDESLALQRQLANRLQEIDKVEQVLSVPHYLDALWKGKAGWERMGRPSDYLLDILTGPNHKHIGTYVMLQAQIDPADKDRAMQVIEAVTSDVCKGKAKAHLVGIPVLAATLTQAAKISSMRYLPLALLACLIALAVSLRSARAVLAVMVSVGVASIWTTGLIAMTGRSLNLITSAIPTVISVLALANGIHIASEFLTECRPTHNRFRVMRRVLTRLIGPVVFTSITTAVGFGSLALSQMKPISEMGMFMSIGIMISGVCNLMIVPGLLLQLSGPGVCHARERGPHWSGRYGAALSKYKWRVSLLSTAAMLGFLGMSTQLKSELNALRFFPDNAGIVKDYQFVAENFSGFSTIEMAIECPKEAFDDTLEALHRLETVLEDCPGVVRVDHLGTIRQFKQSLTDLGCHPSLAGRRVLSKLASRFARSEGQRRYLRVSTLVKVLGESRHACIIDCVKKAAKEVLPAGTRFHPTGITQLLTEAEQQIVCTQTKCFPLAAAIILVAIGLLYRSFRVLMVSIVPNLLPILSVLALMVVLDIPLDAATVMIATIAIGIAADDTIHFLSRYRLYKSQGLPSLDASALTLGEIGRAAFFTSVVAAAGFGTLALSPFPPMRYFGLLTALTMLTALLADVFILPAMCNLLRLWDKTNP